MNTSTYFSWSTEKTTIQLHISEPSFNSWFVSNTNTTVSMLTANRVSVCTENEKLLFSLHHISSPLSPPSDSSEADTPRMPHSCCAPCFSVSLAPTPTHWKVPPGVTRTKASLELSWDAAASSCVGAEMTQVNMCSWGATLCVSSCSGPYSVKFCSLLHNTGTNITFIFHISCTPDFQIIQYILQMIWL